MNIGAKALTSVLQTAQRLSQITGVEDFHRHAINAIGPMLEHTLMSSETHDIDTPVVVASAQTREDGVFKSYMPAFAEYLHQHPCLQLAQQTKRMRIMGVLDRINRNEFCGTALYNEFYRHVGVEDQMVVARSNGYPSLLALAVSRDTLFTPEERTMVDMIAPHMAIAYDNWLAIRNASLKHIWAIDTLNAMRLGAIHVDLQGKVLDYNHHGDKLLRRYYNLRSIERLLPRALNDWFASAMAHPLKPPSPLCCESTQGTLELRLLSSEQTQSRLILLREKPNRPSLEPLVTLGLTRAHAEVLYLVSQGLTYKDVATRLNKAPGTVRKQMEQVFSRLNVSDKAAAAAMATEALQNT